MARAGATIAVMIGPDDEMNATATPSSIRSEEPGRVSADRDGSDGVAMASPPAVGGSLST
jgi:hypothetical protein